MDPQQNQSNPQPTPQAEPAAIPSPVTQPAPDATPPAAQPGVVVSAPQPGQPQGPTPAASVTGVPGAKKSKLPLIFGVVGGLLVIIVVLALAWVLYLSPQAQSKRVANAFMNDMAKGDITAASAISSGGNSNDTQSFLKTSAPAVKGSATPTQSTFKDSKRYTLYSLSGAQRKYARVIVDKEGGNWVAQSFVFSDSALALIPSSKTEDTATAATTPTPAVAATATACLVKSDYFDLENDLGGGNGTLDHDYSTDPDQSAEFGGTIAFLPDSLNFDPSEDLGSYTNDFKISSFVKFYKAHPNQTYKLRLYGVVATTAPSDLAFASQRANKIAGMLESQGVPASKLQIDAPQNIDTYNYGVWKGQEQDPIAQQLARSVPITVSPDKSCVKKS